VVARCIGVGCRMNRRNKHPNLYQLFEALAQHGDA